MKYVQLHVAYVHPAAQGGSIPKSISQKVHPIQVATLVITSENIDMSYGSLSYKLRLHYIYTSYM